MTWTYDVYTFCPEVYDWIQDKSTLYEMLGMETDQDFIECYEASYEQVLANCNQAKKWSDLVPSQWAGGDVYAIPTEICSDGLNFVTLDLCAEATCGECGGYNVLTLSTEAWEIL